MSDNLERVIILANLLARQADSVAALTEQLKEARAAQFATEREDLPTLMQELGLKDITLEDGSKVTIKEEVDAAITAANKPAALDWLNANNFGGIIKSMVTASFGREQHNEAVALAQDLSTTFDSVEIIEGVHAGTLKAFVKEQLAAGAALPLELFGVHPYNIAKITKGK